MLIASSRRLPSAICVTLLILDSLLVVPADCHGGISFLTAPGGGIDFSGRDASGILVDYISVSGADPLSIQSHTFSSDFALRGVVEDTETDTVSGSVGSFQSPTAVGYEPIGSLAAVASGPDSGNALVAMSISQAAWVAWGVPLGSPVHESAFETLSGEFNGTLDPGATLDLDVHVTGLTLSGGESVDSVFMHYERIISKQGEYDVAFSQTQQLPDSAAITWAFSVNASIFGGSGTFSLDPGLSLSPPNAATVPEPSACLLSLVGAAGLLASRRSKANAGVRPRCPANL